MNRFVSLDKYYNFSHNNSSEGHIEYGRELVKTIESTINFQANSILKDDNLDVAVNTRYVDYIIEPSE
jgi:hypothetical protein